MQTSTWITNILYSPNTVPRYLHEITTKKISFQCSWSRCFQKKVFACAVSQPHSIPPTNSSGQIIAWAAHARESTKLAWVCEFSSPWKKKSLFEYNITWFEGGGGVELLMFTDDACFSNEWVFRQIARWKTRGFWSRFIWPLRLFIRLQRGVFNWISGHDVTFVTPQAVAYSM